DLDGDGDTDLAAAGGQPGFVRVYKNNGSGIFSAGVTADASYPNSLAAGDTDGDGDLDLLVGSSTATGAALSHLRGNGDGTYQPASLIGVSGVPMAIAPSDLDGDGDTDIAHTVYQSNQVAVLINAGGSFTARPNVAVADNLFTLAAADLDHDGDLDLATAAETTSTAYVLLNKGGAAFAAPMGMPAGGQSFRVAVSDVDLDGNLDLLTANGNTNNVGLFIGLFGPLSLDLNDDNVPDECQPDCNLNVLPDDLDISLARSPDCNANGIPDECDVAPSLDLADVRKVTVASNPVDAAAGDFNLDGLADVAVALRDSNQVGVLKGRSTGVPAAPQKFATGTEPWALGAGDLDGDGDPDAVTADRGGNTASVLLNGGKTGTGTWQGLGAATAYPLGFQPFALGVADMDGDSDLDVVEAGGANLLGLQRNDGRGKLAAPATSTVANFPNGLGLGDLDGDGDVDAAVACFSGDPGTVSVLRNKGDGAFLPSLDVPHDAVPVAVAIADVSGDGSPDLLLADFTSASVSVLRSQGVLSFVRTGTYPAGPNPFFVAAWDLDGGGDLDIVSASENPGAIAVIRNEGGGSFSRTRYADAGGASFRLAALDFNGDGAVDLASANGRADNVGFLANATSPPVSEDCNSNGIPDSSDIQAQTSRDCDANAVPDECQPDCDSSGAPDACDIAGGQAQDCNRNGLPDSCDIASGAARDENGNGVPDSCEGTPFHRGDSNGDGGVDISDAVFTLGWLFSGGREPSCLEAANVDNGPAVDISDPIALLNYLFASGPAPREPGPTPEPCGLDPDPDGSALDLGCAEYTRC
ncbi:MAG: VCBS repeat-containing protein, partial [Planctomycetes bacterium]|nr:VCBS repeat-containing protein [Planctomycetota bacterium]